MNHAVMFRSIILLITITLTSTVSADAEKLNKIWEIDGFKNPESVIYDKTTNALYVSNVNGSAIEKDGDGFISKVSLEGEILELRWLTGLNAPKGLAIYDNKLYTADIDTLIEIDITEAIITNRYNVSDAKFLNDVAASKDGKIFVSDMMMNRIHCLYDGNFEIWLETTDLESPNGLLVENDRLLVGSWGVMTEGFATETAGHLKAVSFNDKSINSIGDGSPVGNLDGVERDIDGDYYVTDWMAGKLLHIEADGEVEVLLTLVQGMADHEYINGKDLIILPMMKTNKLIAYKAHHYE